MTRLLQRQRMCLAARRSLRAVTAINLDVRPTEHRVSYDMLRDGSIRHRWDPSTRCLLTCPVPSRHSQAAERYILEEQPRSEYTQAVLSVEDEFEMAIAHFEHSIQPRDGRSISAASHLWYYLVTMAPELDAGSRAEMSRLSCRVPRLALWRWIR